MLRTLPYCLALLLSPLVLAAEPIIPTTPIELFNGRDLAGWYPALKGHAVGKNPGDIVKVTDGLLHIAGDERGCLSTEAAYANYRLVAEFKWGAGAYGDREGKARDCGFQLHATGQDGAFHGLWKYAIAAQMIEGGTGDILVLGDGTDAFQVTAPVAEEKQAGSWLFQPDGRMQSVNAGRTNWWGRDPDWKDEYGFRRARDVEKPAGEWNRFEVIADGATLTLVLNGVAVNKVYDVQPRSGQIQIQIEGAEVFFRRIALEPLNADAPQRAKRFFYNSDGDNMFIYADTPMSPEKVYAYIDPIDETQVTTYSFSPNIGMLMNYPTKVAELIGREVSEKLAATVADGVATNPITTERGVQNLRSLIAAGHDPLALVLGRAKEKGMETFISFRLNEVHAVEYEAQDHMILSNFWKAHPEWRIGKVADPLNPVYSEILGPHVHPIVGTWLPAGLNFAIPEVRAQRLAELKELAENYNADGLELDFQRFPMYFPQGQEQQHIATMTAWMREVSAMVMAAGEKRGRPLLLSARIMATPEQNIGIGLDPVAWAKEGLIDFVIVSHYLRNDYPLPIRTFRDLLPESMPIYASIEVEPKEETYRDIARQLYLDGADGIMLFNFFTTRERGEEPPMVLLKELGSAATITRPALSNRP
jgi:hypothetical protein